MSYHRILTAVSDFTQREMLRTAKKMAAHSDAEVTLVHTLKKLNSYALSYSLPSFEGLEQRHMKMLQTKLRYLAEQEGIECQPIVEFGRTNRVIKKIANESAADLIIISKKKVGRWLMSSPPCDMLVVMDRQKRGMDESL